MMQHKYHFQNRFSVNVWCGVLGNNLIGPHVIERYLTAPYYRQEFSRKWMTVAFRGCASWNTKTKVLQHDGALTHFGRAVTEFFKEDYEERGIGRDGSVAWPARSPDWNPLFFFLWGCMRSKVHHGSKPEARHQSVQTIDDAAVGIKNELGRMQWWRSVTQRLAACMQSNGGHFEHAL